MIKIKESLKQGFIDGNKYFLPILSAYLPVYILITLLLSLDLYFPKIRGIQILYAIIVMFLYILFRFGLIGVHYQILLKNRNIHIWKSIFNSFHLKVAIKNITLGFYKYLIGLLYMIIPCIITIAVLQTGTINKLWVLLGLFYIPMIIKLYYSYGFSQLLIVHNRHKHSITCGMTLHINKVLMQGNKMKYLLLQILLIIPRLILAIIVFLLSLLWIHLIIINILIAVVSFIISTCIFIPYIISSKICFYKQIV